MNRAKQFYVLCVLLVLSILSPSAARAQTITSALLTVTNGASNNYSIQINGQYRYFTNVSSNAYNQIVIDTNGASGAASIGGTATNTYYAFAKYPQPQVNFFIPQVQVTNYFTNSPNVYTNIIWTAATNQILFQSFNGDPLAVVLGSNWATITYTTYNTNTYTPLIVPPTGLGVYDLTNFLSGLTAWLNVSSNICGADAIIATNYIWSNFVGAAALASLSNYVGLVATNATNFTYQIGQLETNYASNLFTLSTNYASTNWQGWSNTVFQALNWTTNSFAAIFGNVSYHDLGNLLGLGTSTIYMTNAGTGGYGGQGIRRVLMENNSGAIGGRSVFYDSDGITYWLIRDAGQDTLIYDNSEQVRLDIEANNNANGPMLFYGPDGNVDMTIEPLSDQVSHYKTAILSTATIPVMAIGTFTNFFDGEQNTSSGTTSGLDTVVIPANALTNNGDVLRRHIVVLFNTTGTSRRVQLILGSSTALVDTGVGGLTIAGTGTVDATVTITRTSATGFNYGSSILITGPSSAIMQGTGGPISGFNSGSGWAATTTLAVTLTTASVGGLTGDLQMMTDTTEYLPAHILATFQ